MTASKCVFLVVALAGLLNGCGTPDVNPALPRARSGYVDFYTDSPLGLSWKVKRAAEPNGPLRAVFSQFEPVAGNILRLATPPGTWQFEVWFSNEVTTGPQKVEVTVADGKVTPVRVSLQPEGNILIENKSFAYRSTARATRRVSKISTEEQENFRIVTNPGSPQDYHVKEQMSYFVKPSAPVAAGPTN